MEVPPILNFQLLRFEVDQGNKKKTSDSIAIPETIDLTSYVRQGREILKKTNTAAADLYQEQIEKEEFIYDLYAIFRHSGSSSNYGHYIAEIKSEDDWYVFNDTIVQKLEYCPATSNLPQPVCSVLGTLSEATNLCDFENNIVDENAMKLAVIDVDQDVSRKVQELEVIDIDVCDSSTDAPINLKSTTAPCRSRTKRRKRVCEDEMDGKEQNSKGRKKKRTVSKKVIASINDTESSQVNGRSVPKSSPFHVLKTKSVSVKMSKEDVLRQRGSKNAYMLVYKRRVSSVHGNATTTPIPVHLRDEVLADNAALHNEIQHYEEEFKKMSEYVEMRRNLSSKIKKWVEETEKREKFEVPVSYYLIHVKNFLNFYFGQESPLTANADGLPTEVIDVDQLESVDNFADVTMSIDLRDKKVDPVSAAVINLSCSSRSHFFPSIEYFNDLQKNMLCEHGKVGLTSVPLMKLIPQNVFY